MDSETLRRIISTLANKNDELQNFLETVENTVTGLQVSSSLSYKVMSDLEAELEQLRSVLEEKGAELRHIIKEEQQRKEAELQVLLVDIFKMRTFFFSHKHLELQIISLLEARFIWVTMAPAFRLTTRPAVSDNMSQFTVDFSTERAGLQRLHFLPVPRAPEIDLSNCVVRDNAITVAWQPLGDADSDGGSGPIERYELEYRKTNRDSSRAAGEACWEKICDIRETQVTISGLKFDSPFVVVRVRARNKAAAGDFSEPIAMETKAFNFGFDAVTAHAELKVHGDSVTWEPQGVKGHDPRLRAKDNKSREPLHPPASVPSAGSCTADPEPLPYLRDQEMTGGSYYWELRPLADWKSFSVGVAYRASLGRFDQLGKGAGSWCLSASQWLQTSLAAKHNNRAKALDWPLPQRIGIYCDYDNGDLMFVDVDQLRLLHSFKTKFSQPLVPAFTVWCGGITVATGLQVPSFMGKFASTNQSLSSLTQ
uniref:FSD1-like protein n=1 Tax=Acanthochromis polyacanthus TaxID=80966 RepID=A0A3Q1F8A1_9TELE